jgi:nucleotide-binding universal stress UspA family protein
MFKSFSGKGMWDVKKILLPSDGSSESRIAYAPALDLAKLKEAEIIALYVIRETYIFWEMPHPEIVVELEESEKEYGKKVLEEISEIGRKEGVKVSTQIKKGRPSDTIVKTAKEEGVDLIVMGTQGRGGVKRIIGSVADAVIREAHCPVLAVRQRK